jgi:caffeoyl-CoA O-methyltransferase
VFEERLMAVLDRLEREDHDEREAGLPVMERSRAITPDTGRFLFALVAGQPSCEVLEIGGSRGYSTLWLAAAARILGGHVTTLERDPVKLATLGATIEEAGLDEWVEVVSGDAYQTIPVLSGPFDVVFLDAEKEYYEDFFGLVRGKLEPGAVVVADNVLSHADELAEYVARRQTDPALLSVTVPLGSGIELTSVLTQELLSN